MIADTPAIPFWAHAHLMDRSLTKVLWQLYLNKYDSINPAGLSQGSSNPPQNSHSKSSTLLVLLSAEVIKPESMLKKIQKLT